MEETNDGFVLSEKDLELRGPGEVYGVRQSWVPDFHFADLRDVDLIAEIRSDIEDWIKWNITINSVIAASRKSVW
jgi:RecG-like helicase